VLLVGVVAQLAASPTARADASAVDIYQAAQDVAAGTGTVTEVDEVQRFIDYTQLEFGVSSSSVAYPTIEGTAASSDPGVQALQSATANAPDGGSIEAASGAELSTAAEELGGIASEGGAIAGGTEGAICLTTVACAAVAGGAVAAVVIGTEVVTIFDDGPAMDAASGSTQGTTNATAEAKVWMQPNGACESWPGVSGSWQRLHYYDPTDGKYDLVNPYYNHTIDGANYVGQWTGSAWFNNNGNNYPGSPIAVPCGTPMPNGGLWVLQLKMPQTPSSAAGWAVAINSAWDENSQIPMSADCGKVFWSPPLPGGPGSQSPWQRVTTTDNTGLPGGSNGITGTGLCPDYPNTMPMKQDTELAYEPQTKAHVGFPRSGTCTTAQYVQCITVPTEPTSSWKSDASAIANLFANGALPNLRQFFDAALGVTDPATGQPYTEPGAVAVPAPSAGETWSQYRTDLANAGFINLQREILTSDTADLDQPASAVTVVSPAPGTAIDTSQAVDVTTNPDAMPQPSQREILLANTLAAQNANVDATNKLDVARSCLELEDAGIPNTDTSGDSGDKSLTNCSSLPIFISGQDVREAADHDLAALGVTTNQWMAGQATSPDWVQLNYRPAPQTPGSPSWKRNLWPCTQTQSSQNCDEYPFYASLQGGGQANPLPNLEPIDGPQNQLQGSLYYNAFAVPCGLVAGQAAGGPAPFLAVPLPDGINLNTMAVCNGHSPTAP
jgi:hypothetical protein